MSSSLPATYKALSSKVNEQLQFIELPIPKDLKEGEILIKIKYAGVNPMDYKFQVSSALVNMFSLPSPMVVGFEFSGNVAATTSNSNYSVGQQVFGFCPIGQCFAEYLRVKESLIHVLPDGVDFRLASTVGIVYITAYESLYVIDDIENRKGQTIFIQGLSGGVGYAAAQIAKQRGLIVIGTSSNQEAIDYMKNILKVDHIINYKKQNVAEEVMKITNGRGCDLVYDPTYLTSAMTQSAGLVAKGGVWFRLGGWNHGQPDEEARKIVEERGATATIGDFGRYWFNPEYAVKLPQLWKDTCDDFIAVSQAGNMNIRVNEVKFDAASLQKILDTYGNGSSRFGRDILKIY